jgi:hypothetical protein
VTLLLAPTVLSSEGDFETTSSSVSSNRGKDGKDGIACEKL